MTRTVDKLTWIDLPDLLGLPDLQALNQLFFRFDHLAYAWDEAEFMHFERMVLEGAPRKQIAAYYGCGPERVTRLRDKLRLK